MSRYLDPKADTPAELDIYESYWDQISREKTLIMGKYDKGKADGKAEVAIQMLKMNRTIDEIILLTGLSEQTIAQLKNEQ
jgi:hypothetical protein